MQGKVGLEITMALPDKAISSETIFLDKRAPEEPQKNDMSILDGSRPIELKIGEVWKFDELTESILRTCSKSLESIILRTINS